MAKLQMRKTKYTNLSHKAEIWVLKLDIKMWEDDLCHLIKIKQIKETVSIIFAQLISYLSRAIYVLQY